MTQTLVAFGLTVLKDIFGPYAPNKKCHSEQLSFLFPNTRPTSTWGQIENTHNTLKSCTENVLQMVLNKF